MSKVYKKNNKNTKILRTLGLTGTSLLTVLSLASCKKSANIYSAIDSDSVYSSIGNYKVTNLDLFKELSWSGASQLNSNIEDAIVSSYLTDVTDAVLNSDTDSYKNNHDAYVEKLRELLICDIFGVDTISSYFGINSFDSVNKLIAQGLDNLYTNYGIKLTEEELLSLAGLSKTGTTGLLPSYIENETLPTLKYESMTKGQKSAIAHYYSKLANKLFALNYLNDEITDYETDNNDGIDITSKNYSYYFKDSDIISKWKTEYYYKHTSVNGLMLRFVSEDEITQTLKTFGVKLYNGNFYFIRQQIEEDGALKTLSDSEYDKHYSDFDFTLASNQNNYIKLNGLGVLLVYVEMYNYLYTYRDELPSFESIEEARKNNNTSSRRNITQVICNSMNSEDLTEEEFYKQYLLTSSSFADYINHNGDEMSDISDSYRNMLYEDLDDYSYSTSGKSHNDYYYLNYRFNVDTTELDSLGYNLYYKSDANGDVTQKDENGKEEKADSSVIDRTRSKDILEKVVDILKDEKLTSSYITSAINKSKEDAKISIYDENLSISYAVSYADYYSKTWGKASSDDIIAKVEYDDNTYEIKTSDLYKELETSLGLTTAIDMLTKQIIKDTDEYKKTEANVDEYYSQLNNILTSFSNGGLSTYGYDASIGKYNFLMTYFHSSDVNEIINDTYRVNDANTAILSDYASDKDLIKLFAKYASQAYNNTFTISATDLLVYVDFDEDESPDKYFDWSQSVTVTNSDGTSETTTYEALAKELIEQISNIMENSSDTFATSISNIVDEYKTSGRFTNGYDTSVDSSNNYDPTGAEKYWAKYKRAGLQIKSTEYSSITNSSDATSIPYEIQNELMDIYKRSDFIVNDSAPSEYLDYKPYESGEGLTSTEGYNLVVVTSATVNASAKFESTKDLNKIYSNLYYYYNEELTYIKDIYNENDELTENQILAYILEYADNSTSETIPSAISSALSTFFSPIYTKYTSTACQRELLINWCENKANSSFTFANSLNEDSSKFYFVDGTSESYSERFTNIRNINKRSADSYSDTREFKHQSVYDDFWGDLETYIKTKYSK